MDFRYLIVGTPFVIAFFYTLFWLKRWGAFNSSSHEQQKKMNIRNERSRGELILENIFLTKN